MEREKLADPWKVADRRRRRRAVRRFVFAVAPSWLAVWLADRWRV